MKTLYIIGILSVGFFLSGCIVPVSNRYHDGRRYDGYRNAYPVRVDVVPVIEVRH